ncbi:alginate O-acetyltransferase AlgX-related protein [Shimia sp.]|uniref:alginate O-acetyltransferase AlgX-related protein n=1 Tax=Shimia sp. TaxID=1954381 RepID=UPI003B8CD2E5
MKLIFPLIVTFFAAASAQAAPYCTELLDKSALPKKYAKSAPIYSDTASGWMFTQDQLKDRYDMKTTSRQLVQAIVDEFAKRNVPLAIVVPPPRPVVAGQTKLDAAMGGTHYDVAAAQNSFDLLIQGLSATGATVPNLSDVALSDPDIQKNFYFHRDTHWTTTGSAVSAMMLARAVNENSPDLFSKDGEIGFQDLRTSGTIKEKGSLAEVARKTCGASLTPETAESYDLSRDVGLLETSTEGASIALLGSSFSNRYKRDHYRFADALARAFDADVENFSVSGGGPIGAIEAYVLSGALDRREHALVVWELPYTESFNSHSFLRQLLGALQLGNASRKSVQENQGEAAITLKAESGITMSGIEIVSADNTKQSFKVEVRFDNGSTSKVFIGRRNAVPADMRSSRLLSSFSHFGNRTPTEVVVSSGKGARIVHVALF